MPKGNPKSKAGSIFEALADKSQKPDLMGFQPIDPAKWAAVVRAIDKGRV